MRANITEREVVRFPTFAGRDDVRARTSFGAHVALSLLNDLVDVAVVAADENVGVISGDAGDPVFVGNEA